jgi:hypothetical protein
VQALQELGWTDGRNVRIDTRWAAGDPNRYRSYAAELVALAPDVILVSDTAAVGPLQQATLEWLHRRRSELAIARRDDRCRARGQVFTDVGHDLSGFNIQARRWRWQ